MLPVVELDSARVLVDLPTVIVNLIFRFLTGNELIYKSSL